MGGALSSEMIAWGGPLPLPVRGDKTEHWLGGSAFAALRMDGAVPADRPEQRALSKHRRRASKAKDRNRNDDDDGDENRGKNKDNDENHYYHHCQCQCDFMGRSGLCSRRKELYTRQVMRVRGHETAEMSCVSCNIRSSWAAEGLKAPVGIRRSVRPKGLWYMQAELYHSVLM